MDEYTPREVAFTVATNQETSNTGEYGERFGTGSQNFAPVSIANRCLVSTIYTLLEIQLRPFP